MLVAELMPACESGKDATVWAAPKVVPDSRATFAAEAVDQPAAILPSEEPLRFTKPKLAFVPLASVD